MGLYLLVQLFWLLTTVDAIASQPLVTTKPGCPDKCGTVSIPYPFGIGDRCHVGVSGFNITCDDSLNPPKPFRDKLEVLNISLVQGLMRISHDIKYQCYDKTGNRTWVSDSWVDLNPTESFTFSETHNKFTAIGCDTIAYMYSSNFTSGCISFCNDNKSVIDGSCSGLGCCQNEIPKGLKRFYVELRTRSQHKTVWNFNPCSYAFLAEKDAFHLNAPDLIGKDAYARETYYVPLVLEWGIGNEPCQIAGKDSANFACVGEGSTCYNSTNGLGYRCNCSQGYRGNAYLPGGCQDINECEEDHDKKLCQHNCINSRGGYYCSCKKGYSVLQGDKRYCTKNKSVVFNVLLGVGIGVSLLLLLIGVFWSYWAWRKRRLIKQKENFFKQNGGFLLEEKRQSFAETFKIFTREELQTATNNYDKSQIVGQGGFGTVYKGILRNNRMVAVKKSKIVDQTQIEQFINEVHILSQISHRNIVQLLGCCLEEEVPILVYEFISNGTLSEHIHGDGYASSLSLENRLRIATETAGALYYLHSIASAPIFHRDVKSANVLLDNNFTSKVSDFDFGASRLVRLDQTQVTTLVMGTWGYLDPEYHQTGQLTAKSDVYGFGIVLLELLTGERPISSTRSEEYKSLSRYFLSSTKENRLFEILEDRVRDEGEEEELMAVAQLAKRCLKLKGEERPTMKEVVVELEGLRSHEHPWEPNNHEEIEILLGETSQGHASNSTYSTCEYSVDSHTLSALEIGH